MKQARRPKLEPETIAKAALDVLDEVGLDELSMRRLAESLGVQNPALYWHVRNKQELLDRMAQTILETGLAAAEASSPTPRSWAKKLERFAHGLRYSMRSRRDGARLVAAANLAQPGNVLLGRIESLVTSLVAEGLRAPDALRGVLAVIHYTLGATLEEQSDPRPGEPELPEGALPPGLAALAELAGRGDRSHLDARFEFGVQLLVEGLRSRMSR